MILSVWKDKGGGSVQSALPLLVLIVCLGSVYTLPDVTVTLNTRKVLSTLDERFLSFTVDPEDLAARSYGPISRSMAQALSPAYLRIAGPSSNNYTLDGDHITLNSHVFYAHAWREINSFLNSSGINVVLCLNVLQRLHNVWDSSKALEVVNANDKLGLQMDYQLGYENQEYLLELTSDEVARNIIRLRSILDGFSSSKSSHIIGPDFTQFDPKSAEQMAYIKNFVKATSFMIDAITVHPSFSLEKDVSTAVVKAMDVFNDSLFAKAGAKKKSIWLAESELEVKKPGFETTINSVIELGVAAQSGADIFLLRPQPFYPEHTTPDFWMAALHKALVGTTVLTSRSSHVHLHTFTHCTRASTESNPINYEAGSVTIFGTNTHTTQDVQLSIRSSPLKDEAVHMYVLTYDAMTGKSYLNEKELSIASNGDFPIITPIEKELLGNSFAKSSLENVIRIPKRSIFFIVLPENRAKSCLNKDRQNSVFQLLGNRNGNTKIAGKSFFGKLGDIKSMDRTRGRLVENLGEDFDWTSLKSSTTKFNPTPDGKEIKTKYVTFSDNNWLSKFPEKVHKNTLFDDEFPKNSFQDIEKYNRYRRHEYEYSPFGDTEELNIDYNPQKFSHVKEPLSSSNKENLEESGITNLDQKNENSKQNNDKQNGDAEEETSYNKFKSHIEMKDEPKNEQFESVELDSKSIDSNNAANLGDIPRHTDYIDLMSDRDTYDTIDTGILFETMGISNKETGVTMQKNMSDIKESNDLIAKNIKTTNPTQNVRKENDSVPENFESMRRNNVPSSMEENMNKYSIHNVKYELSTEDNNDEKDFMNVIKDTNIFSDQENAETFTERDPFEFRKKIDFSNDDLNVSQFRDDLKINDKESLFDEDNFSALQIEDTNGNFKTSAEIFSKNYTKDIFERAKVVDADYESDHPKQEETPEYLVKEFDTVSENENLPHHESDKNGRDQFTHESEEKYGSKESVKKIADEVITNNVAFEKSYDDIPKSINETENKKEEKRQASFINKNNKLKTTYNENVYSNSEEPIQKKIIKEDETEFQFNMKNTNEQNKSTISRNESKSTDYVNNHETEVPTKIPMKTQNRTNIMKIPKNKIISKRDVFHNRDSLISNLQEGIYKPDRNDELVPRDIRNEHTVKKLTSANENEKLLFVPQITVFDSNFHRIGVLDNVDGKNNKNKEIKPLNHTFALNILRKNETKDGKMEDVPFNLVNKEQNNHSKKNTEDRLPESDPRLTISEPSKNDPTVKQSTEEEQVNNPYKSNDFTSEEEQEVIKRITENRKRSPNYNNYFDFAESFLIPTPKEIKSFVNYPSYKNIIHHAVSYSPHKINDKDIQYSDKSSVTSFLPKHASHRNKTDFGGSKNFVDNNKLPMLTADEYETNSWGKILKENFSVDSPKVANIKTSNLENSNIFENKIEFSNETETSQSDNTDVTNSSKENDENESIKLNYRSSKRQNDENKPAGFRDLLQKSQLDGTTVDNIGTYLNISEIPILNSDDNDKNVKLYFKRNHGTFKSDYENIMSKILNENKIQERKDIESERQVKKGKKKTILSVDNEERDTETGFEKGLDISVIDRQPLDLSNKYNDMTENDYQHTEQENLNQKANYDEYEENDLKKGTVYENEDGNNEYDQYIDKISGINNGKKFAFKTLKHKIKHSENHHPDEILKVNDYLEENYMDYENQKYNEKKWNRTKQLKKLTKEALYEKLEDDTEAEYDDDDDDEEDEEGSTFFKNLLNFKHTNISYGNDSAITDKLNSTSLNLTSIHDMKDGVQNVSNNTLNSTYKVYDMIRPILEETEKNSEIKQMKIHSDKLLESGKNNSFEEKVHSKRIIRNINNDNYNNLGINSDSKYFKLNKDKEYVQLFPYVYNSTHNQLLDFNSNKQNENLIIPKVSPISINEGPIYGAKFSSFNSSSQKLGRDQEKTLWTIGANTQTISNEKQPEKIHGIDSSITQVQSVQNEINYDPKISDHGKMEKIWSPHFEPSNKDPIILPLNHSEKELEKNLETRDQDNAQSDVYKHGYNSETPLLYDFFSRQESKEHNSPFVYPSVVPKEPLKNYVDISKSYTSAYDYSKQESIKNDQPNIKNHTKNDSVENNINTYNKVEPITESIKLNQNLDSLSNKRKETTEKPNKPLKKEEETKEVDVIEEMKKAIFPNGPDQEIHDKKSLKKSKTLMEKIKDMKHRRDKLFNRQDKKIFKTKKEIDKTDLEEPKEYSKKIKPTDILKENSLNRKVLTLNKMEKPHIDNKKNKTKSGKTKNAQDFEYLRKEEEIIQQRDKHNNNNDEIPVELLKLDHDLELEEIKRNNRGILSSVVTKPEHENAIKFADKLLGGVQSFMQKLDPLAGNMNESVYKEPKTKQKLKPKYKSKLKQSLLKKNLLKSTNKKPLTTRFPTKFQSLNIRKNNPSSIFSKGKRNVYRNRFEKQENIVKRDISASEQSNSQSKIRAKRHGVNIRQDENDHLLTEIYNDIDGQKQNHRYSRHVSSDLMKFDPYANDAEIEDRNFDPLNNYQTNYDSKIYLVGTQDDQIENKNPYAVYERNEKLKNKTIDSYQTNSQRGNTQNNSFLYSKRLYSKPDTLADHQNKDNMVKGEVKNSASEVEKIFNVGKDISGFNDVYEESLYNLVSENNLVNNMNALVSPTNANTELEEPDKDIIQNLLKEDFKLKNIYKELNPVKDGIRKRELNVSPIRKKRQSMFEISSSDILEPGKLKHIPKYIAYIKTNIDLLNALADNIINENNGKFSINNTEVGINGQQSPNSQEENDMLRSNYILRKKSTSGKQTNNAHKHSNSDLLQDNNMNNLLLEEIATDLNKLSENTRNKRSINDINNNYYKYYDKEIDDVDFQLLKTNKMKKSIFSKDSSLINFDTSNEESLKSNGNMTDKIKGVRDRNDTTEKANKKPHLYDNSYDINQNRTSNKSFYDSTFSNQTHVDTMNISNKTNLHYERLYNSSKEKLNMQPTSPTPPYITQEPEHNIIPTITTYRFIRNKNIPNPIIRYSGNNLMNLQQYKNITPRKKYKIYLKKFNRFKREKRTVDHKNIELVQPIASIPSEKSSNYDYSLLTNFINGDPNNLVEKRRDSIPIPTTTMYSNFIKDDALHMIPKNEYERIINNEVAKSKLRTMGEKTKEDKLAALLKKINNEVDLIEYIELQRSKQSKLTKSNPEELEEKQLKKETVPLSNNIDYIKKYQNIFNQVMQDGNNIDAGVKNLNNQIELFNEPLSKAVLKDILTKEEADQRLIFDDDFQNALVHNSPIESVHPSQTLDGNIINTIIINPFNDFLTKFNNKMRSILNTTSTTVEPSKTNHPSTNSLEQIPVISKDVFVVLSRDGVPLRNQSQQIQKKITTNNVSSPEEAMLENFHERTIKEIDMDDLINTIDQNDDEKNNNSNRSEKNLTNNNYKNYLIEYSKNIENKNSAEESTSEKSKNSFHTKETGILDLVNKKNQNDGNESFVSQIGDNNPTHSNLKKKLVAYSKTMYTTAQNLIKGLKHAMGNIGNAFS